MKTGKIIRRIVWSILGTSFLLFIALVIHIATVKPTVYDNATLQISRIDFKEPIDTLKAKEIHRTMKSIAGVKNDRLNPKTGVMVYFHDNRIVNSEQVFIHLITKGHYKAERYVLPEALASKKVCPVMDANSFSYKFSRGIQRIFN